jgi:hypothetical protein
MGGTDVTAGEIVIVVTVVIGIETVFTASSVSLFDTGCMQPQVTTITNKNSRRNRRAGSMRSSDLSTLLLKYVMIYFSEALKKCNRDIKIIFPANPPLYPQSHNNPNNLPGGHRALPRANTSPSGNIGP